MSGTIMLTTRNKRPQLLEMLKKINIELTEDEMSKILDKRFCMDFDSSSEKFKEYLDMVVRNSLYNFLREEKKMNIKPEDLK